MQWKYLDKKFGTPVAQPTVKQRYLVAYEDPLESGVNHLGTSVYRGRGKWAVVDFKVATGRIYAWLDVDVPPNAENS